MMFEQVDHYSDLLINEENNHAQDDIQLNVTVWNSTNLDKFSKEQKKYKMNFSF